MKWASIIIAVFLPCAIAALFLRLEFASAMTVSLALVAVIFFATLPWTVGSIMDRWRSRHERPQGGTVVKAFEDESTGPRDADRAEYPTSPSSPD